MKRGALAVGLVCLAATAACIVPSLHPILEDKDVRFDKRVVGVWVDPENVGGGTWEFTRDGDTEAYRLVITEEDGKKGVWRVRMGRVKDVLLFDAVPLDEGIAGSGLYKLHFIGVHSFAVVDALDPALELRFMKPDWLKKELEARPEAIRHETLGEGKDQRILLTADTRALQSFFLDHLKTPEAFTEPLRLVRRDDL